MNLDSRVIKLVQRAKRNLWQRPRLQLWRTLGMEPPPKWLQDLQACWKELLGPWARTYQQMRILEIECQDGRSSRWIAKNFLSTRQARLTCVDSWPAEGTENHEAKLFKLFQRNIAFKKKRVRALRGDIAETMQSLKNEQFDLIFINGDWEVEPTSALSTLALSMLAPGGRLLWGLYGTRPSVRLGATRACAESQVPLSVWGEQVHVSKFLAPSSPAIPQKVIGLVQATDKEEWMAFSLRVLAQLTDAIVVLSDSADSSVDIPESMAKECHITVMYRSNAEEGDVLLKAGRTLGGTHFVVLKSDEVFTSGLVQTGRLRQFLMSLLPGESLQLPVFELWRGLDYYRADVKYQTVAFRDNGKGLSQSGACKILLGDRQGVAWLSNVNWDNLLVRQARARCRDRIAGKPFSKPVLPCDDVALKKANPGWLRDFVFFQKSVVGQRDLRSEKQISQWLDQYGDDYFKGLDIGESVATFRKPPIDKSKPLVSVLVSTYKSERFLRGCLEDLERQTIADHLEIIVVNSGSPENEESIVREFQQRFKNIVYLRTERETVYQAWNRAIGLARGKYLTNSNTDDRHAPEALEKLAAALENRPDISLVYAYSAITQTENVTLEKGPVTGYFRWPSFDERLLFSICYVGPQPMWRHSLHEQFGLFDPSFLSAGDYEFWLRICRKTRFLRIPEVLGLYLESMTSVEHTSPSIQESEIARKRHWPVEWQKMPEQMGTFLERFEDRSGIP